MEGFDGRIEPFNELIHFIRPHKGQIVTAQRINEFLEGSEIIAQEKETRSGSVFFPLYAAGSWCFKRCN